jgi:hypothetical protein
MNSLENLLNNAVEEKGWRISPRASLEDRLVRYMQLSSLEKGRELNDDDARGAAQLMILRNGGSNTVWSSRAAAAAATPETNVWSGRTRSSTRPDFVEPTPDTSRTVRASRDGDVRVTLRTDSGSHPMVRRSQVNSSTHPMTRRSQVSSSR